MIFFNIWNASVFMSLDTSCEKLVTSSSASSKVRSAYARDRNDEQLIAHVKEKAREWVSAAVSALEGSAPE